MRASSRTRRVRALLCATAMAGAPAAARAEPPEGQATAPPSEAPAYTLEVDSDDPGAISHEALAERLAVELGAEVAPSSAGPAARAALLVRYRAAEHALTVRAVHGGVQALERRIEVTGDPAEIQREAVLLAGNLARDEARELLDALARPAPLPAAPAPPAPAPPAAVQAPAPAEPAPGRVPVSVAFAYPIASNHGRPDVASAVDLSLLYGRVGSANAQIGSGLVAASRGISGAQLAAGAAYAREVTGAQLAAGGTLAGRVLGAQLAAGVAVARDVSGAQLATVNVARDARGAQLGIVNVGRTVRGVQVGVVNLAERADAALGLVSITRDGVHPVAWGSSLSHANAGLRFESRLLYTTIAFSVSTLESRGTSAFGATSALGTNVRLAGALDVDGEVALSQMSVEPDGRPRGSNTALHVRLVPGYRFAERLRLVAGGGIRIPLAMDEGRYAVRPELVVGVQF